MEVFKMKKGIKKGLFIGGTAVVIAASSIAGGWFFAEKHFGQSDNRLISEKDIETQRAEQQQTKEIAQQVAEANAQASQRHDSSDPDYDMAGVFKITSIKNDTVHGEKISGVGTEIDYPLSAFAKYNMSNIKVGDQIIVGWPQATADNMQWDNIDYMKQIYSND
jgi:cytoskeletal protein RodZ